MFLLPKTIGSTVSRGPYFAEFQVSFLCRIIEFIAKVIGFRYKIDVINVFDHYDVHDHKWKGIVGMVKIFILDFRTFAGDLFYLM